MQRSVLMINKCKSFHSFFSLHCRDYLKLSSLVNRLDYCILKSSNNKASLPNLHNLIYLLKIQCSAKYDACENQPKWTEPPNLAGKQVDDKFLNY